MSEDLSKRIESLLLAYRTRAWVDGDGYGINLVTAFTPPSDLTAGIGRAEVSELADYLAGELGKALRISSAIETREAYEVGASNAREAIAGKLQAERDTLYRCVKWYADGNHCALDNWEPPDEPNWMCPPLEIETTKADRTRFDPKVGPKPAEKVTVDLHESWMVEDGGVARFVLAGGVLPDMDDGDDCEQFRLHEGAVPLTPPAALASPTPTEPTK